MIANQVDSTSTSVELSRRPISPLITAKSISEKVPTYHRVNQGDEGQKGYSFTAEWTGQWRSELYVLTAEWSGTIQDREGTHSQLSDQGQYRTGWVLIQPIIWGQVCPKSCQWPLSVRLSVCSSVSLSLSHTHTHCQWHAKIDIYRLMHTRPGGWTLGSRYLPSCVRFLRGVSVSTGQWQGQTQAWRGGRAASITTSCKYPQKWCTYYLGGLSASTSCKYPQKWYTCYQYGRDLGCQHKNTETMHLLLIHTGTDRNNGRRMAQKLLQINLKRKNC